MKKAFALVSFSGGGEAMGYRSDVGYVIVFRHDTNPEKAYTDFVHFTNSIKEEIEKDRQSGLTLSWAKHLHVCRENLTVSFGDNDTKWYPDYPEVKWHEELLARVKTYSTGNYRFVRVGEDYEDIEQDTHDPTAFMWDYIDIRREVVFQTEEGERFTDVFEVQLTDGEALLDD
jgi:hypothetical protein